MCGGSSAMRLQPLLTGRHAPKGDAGRESKSLTLAACRGLGLELSIRAWLRGQHSKSLRAAMSSIRSAAMKEDIDCLRRYSVPEKVLASGCELASFLINDLNTTLIWRNNHGNVEHFQAAAVTYLEHRFDISVPPVFLKMSPGLVVKRRTGLYDASGKSPSSRASSPGGSPGKSAASPALLPGISIRMEGADQQDHGNPLFRPDLGAEEDADILHLRAKLGEHVRQSMCAEEAKGVEMQQSEQQSKPKDGVSDANDVPNAMKLDARKPMRPRHFHFNARRCWEEPEFLGPDQPHEVQQSVLSHRLSFADLKQRQSTGYYLNYREIKRAAPPRQRVANIDKPALEDKDWVTWLRSSRTREEHEEADRARRDIVKMRRASRSGSVVASPTQKPAPRSDHRYATDYGARQRERKSPPAGTAASPASKAEKRRDGKFGDISGQKNLLQFIDKATVVNDMEELHRIFQEYDEDMSGTIEAGEFPPLLMKMLKRKAGAIDLDEVWNAWGEIDADGSGQITMEELQTWFCVKFEIDFSPDFSNFFIEDEILSDDQRKLRDIAKEFKMDLVHVEEIHKEFMKWDSDNSGQIDIDEFSELMYKLFGVNSESGLIPEHRMRMFFNEIDVDHSGDVTLEEFVRWYSKYFYGKLTPMEHYYKTLGSGWRSAGKRDSYDDAPEYSPRQRNKNAQKKAGK